MHWHVTYEINICPETTWKMEAFSSHVKWGKAGSISHQQQKHSQRQAVGEEGDMCLEKEEQLVAIYETVFGSVVGCSKQTHANKHLGMQPDFGSDRGLGMSVFFLFCMLWMAKDWTAERISVHVDVSFYMWRNVRGPSQVVGKEPGAGPACLGSVGALLLNSCVTSNLFLHLPVPECPHL